MFGILAQLIEIFRCLFANFSCKNIQRTAITAHFYNIFERLGTSLLAKSFQRYPSGLPQLGIKDISFETFNDHILKPFAFWCGPRNTWHSVDLFGVSHIKNYLVLICARRLFALNSVLIFQHFECWFQSFQCGNLGVF